MTLVRPSPRPLLRTMVRGLVREYESLDPATEALIARFTTPPTSERTTLINNLIVALKDGGVWSKLDVLWITAAADAQAGQRNWISDNFNLTPVNSPTFTADRGYAGNGTTSYLTTGYNPGGAGTFKYLQDNCAMGIWSRTNSDATVAELGARTSSTLAQSIMLLRTTNLFSIRANSNTATTVANTDSSGFFIQRRTASNATAAFRNGSALGTGSVASVALVNTAWLFGAASNNGTPALFSARELSLGLGGGSLTDGEIAAANAAFAAYMTAVGAA